MEHELREFPGETVSSSDELSGLREISNTDEKARLEKLEMKGIRPRGQAQATQHTSTWIPERTHTQIHTHTHTQIQREREIHTHTQIHTHTLTHTYTQIHTQTQTNTHTHTHTHTQLFKT